MLILNSGILQLSLLYFYYSSTISEVITQNLSEGKTSMLSIFHKNPSRSEIIFLTVITSFIFSPPIAAQVLEEIIVTAQRREQSLQEVPISIHAVSGLELSKQGFRTMEDLGQFSPSVEIAENLHDWSVTIRGMGNDVAAMAVEQSAPIFVDGIHMGRPSMIKGAFMDVERVEVLTGPQPVYFGQNATAGAFSITTKKPTAEWEGDATAEFGNFGRINFEGGIGGPLTDTIGVRIAGQWDKTGGHLTDIYTGNSFPNRVDSGARITLAWNPTENFEGTAKLEYMRRRSDGDTNTICLGKLDPDGFSHDNWSIILPGEIPEFTNEIKPVPNCADGFGKFGVQEGTGQFLKPIQGINNDDARSGILDIRDLARTYGPPDGNLTSREPLDALTFRTSGRYELSNGVSIEGTYAYIDYERDTFESSDESPYLMEAAFRTELFNMHSGEIRATSPSGGSIEWSAGVYTQTEKLDMDPVRTLRAEIRQPLRIHHPYQDSNWKSVFANVTFNFLDDKASLDIGGRYSDVTKHGGITAEYATWIFDINPDPDGDGIVESTTHLSESKGGDKVRTDVGEAIIDCGTGLTIDGGTPDKNQNGRTVWDDQCGSFGAGFYTHEWRETDIPDPWDTMSPVAQSQPIWGLDRTGGRTNGPFKDDYAGDSFDPQITLRYRPTPNHSLYAKWAKAFKAGGFDTSDRGIPRGGLQFVTATGNVDKYGADGQKEFQFNQEDATVYEIGAKGNLFDGRVRYAGTLFYQKITDLQVETEIADIALLLSGEPPTGRFLTNAGAQRNQGLEYGLGWAATDRLTYTLDGVFQDSKIIEFLGGCTEFESLNAATTDCFTHAESAAFLGLEVGDSGSDALEDNIQRAGYKAPRAPDWKFIVGMDYELPLFDRYVGKLNGKIAVSDEYTEDTLGFTEVIIWPVHADFNMLVGIGDIDGTWDVNIFLRNLLGARQVYQPEQDFELRGRQTDDMPQSSWFNYGIQFNYHFR
jgi:outer membrane receptor protein involved in Fe transport